MADADFPIPSNKFSGGRKLTEGELARLLNRLASSGEWALITDIVTLETTWAVQSGGQGDWHPLQFRILPDGTTVEFRGAIGSTGAIVGDALFTLPAAMRPWSDTTVHMTDGAGAVRPLGGIDSSEHATTPGEMSTNGALTHPDFVNFDGARYSIAPDPAA